MAGGKRQKGGSAKAPHTIVKAVKAQQRTARRKTARAAQAALFRDRVYRPLIGTTQSGLKRTHKVTLKSVRQEMMYIGTRGIASGGSVSTPSGTDPQAANSFTFTANSKEFRLGQAPPGFRLWSSQYKKYKITSATARVTFTNAGYGGPSVTTGTGGSPGPYYNSTVTVDGTSATNGTLTEKHICVPALLCGVLVDADPAEVTEMLNSVKSVLEAQSRVKMSYDRLLPNNMATAKVGGETKIQLRNADKDDLVAGTDAAPDSTWNFTVFGIPEHTKQGHFMANVVATVELYQDFEFSEPDDKFGLEIDASNNHTANDSTQVPTTERSMAVDGGSGN
jgi:hypothetical protein